MMYTDSREDKGAFVSMTADDSLYGYSSFHLCRKCFDTKFPYFYGGYKSHGLLMQRRASDENHSRQDAGATERLLV